MGNQGKATNNNQQQQQPNQPPAQQGKGLVFAISKEDGLLFAYRRYISTKRMLSAEDERRLSTIIRNPASEEERSKAIGALVEGNLRLAYMLAEKHRGLLPMEDLIQEANLGLIKAARKYDSSKSKFSTYAYLWILQEIQRAASLYSCAVSFPPNSHDIWHKISSFKTKFYYENEREPTTEEIIDCLPKEMKGDGLRIIESIYAFAPPRSLPEDEEGDYVERICRRGEEEEVRDYVESRELHERLEEAIGKLPRMSQNIVRARYGLGGEKQMTIADIALRYNMDRERVTNILRRALRAMRATMLTGRIHGQHQSIEET